MGRSQRPEHGRCGRRVGWRHDGAQRDRRGPRQRRYERAGDDGDGGGRESDREDDEAGQRGPVFPEISRRRVVGRIEQDGRDEERQRKLGGDGERRRPGKKGEQRAAEREEDRIRCADAARPGRQEDSREEETEKVFQPRDSPSCRSCPAPARWPPRRWDGRRAGAPDHPRRAAGRSP